MLLTPDSPDVRRIDTALADWRQGDLALDEHWFIYVADATCALTSESAQAGEGLQAITVEVEGLVVVTQSCDVCRTCSERPFVEVSPLVFASNSVIL